MKTSRKVICLVVLLALVLLVSPTLISITHNVLFWPLAFGTVSVSYFILTTCDVSFWALAFAVDSVYHFFLTTHYVLYWALIFCCC